MNKFKFDLRDEIKLIKSDEQGTVIGRAEYLNLENQYRVLYRAADGRQTECWWDESAIEAA